MDLSELVARGTILRATVGSTVHGLHHGGQGDRDEMAVFIEPPECRLGLKLARGQGRKHDPARATSTSSPTTCASTSGLR